MTQHYIDKVHLDRVAAALGELGVATEGVCPNELFKLLRWHILFAFPAESLNELGGEDKKFHDSHGIESYWGTYEIHLK